ncbi:endo-1,4-beta-xylanase [Rheinheimera tangshanensis]|uniref:Beta-xylanase n=1 Tax=Rheinheimera tangshanensis TaxID=400153 RepID=A0A5C8LYB5_9GAMM|nr:endo-1,4-beta-xylanase [Rheinheimera tangshanensis]TXK80558.1 endo-1,4-beta-xylanase [Rheinheimera tangshanensis]GGM60326.1 hypothetical protein GCM10010920_21230 [Rheinheimera tangshanensis]
MFYDFSLYIKGLFFFFLFAPFCSEARPLRDIYKNDFIVGVALANSDLDDPKSVSIVNREFNSIVAEFGMKMIDVIPKPGIYDFYWPDKFLRFAEENGHSLIGHTLVWHKNSPDWFFRDEQGNPLKREQLLVKLQEHINTYVGRYRGRVTGWDVVNEAFNNDGSFRKSPWFNIIGDDYIEKAFEFTHLADPTAELYYNDYGLVHSKKQEAVISLVKRIRSKGIPVHAIGIQGHYSLQFPDLSKLDQAISRFSKEGINVMITELDVSVLPFVSQDVMEQGAIVSEVKKLLLNPYPNKLPDSIADSQSNRYVELFCIFIKHSEFINRVTFWGISDKHSWLNHWPVNGRVDYPLLFDREMKPKNALKRLKEVKLSSDLSCR